MPITLASARAALRAASGPYLTPIRATALRAGLDGSMLAEGPLLDAAVSAGLAGAGLTPTDPTAPADGDLAALPAADWPKFLAVAELTLLEAAAAAMAALPDELSAGGGEVRYGWDAQALLKILEARRAAILKRFPDAVDPAASPGLTGGVATFLRPAPGCGPRRGRRGWGRNCPEY